MEGINFNQEDIIERLEARFSTYEKFEKCILKHIYKKYFPFVYQSLYNQLGYDKLKNNKFTTSEFKTLLSENNFLNLVNEIYRTRLSKNASKEIRTRLREVDNFDDYESVLHIFKRCNQIEYKNGRVILKNAFSFGTKLLHFYNPEENPILDSVVRENLRIGEMNRELCLEFRRATKYFVEKHRDYFDMFCESKNIAQELEKRHMTNKFPKMEIIDMALYEDNRV